MPKYFDIKNISRDKWAGSIHLHLNIPGRGVETVSLPRKGVLEGISDKRITPQVRLLAKRHSVRPPLIQLVEVDHEQRLQDRKEKNEQIIKRAAAEKLKMREKAAEVLRTPEPQAVEESEDANSFSAFSRGSKKRAKKQQGIDEQSDVTAESIE